MSENNFEKSAMNVSVGSIAVNLILAALKLIAGLIAKSGAMISDAVHSASDVFSTIIVIIGIRFSSKPSDKSHSYGHERFECVASILLAVLLCVTGFELGKGAVASVTNPATAVPGVLALVAAIVSILVKEAMYHVTKKVAIRIDSSALMADAWHHRSDALSSVGALVGIGLARAGFVWADAAASFIICLFIEKVSYDIFMDAVDHMVDKSCDEEKEKEIREFIASQDDVKAIDLLQTRTFGNRIYIDLEISLDSSLTLIEGHEVAEKVHDAIEKRFLEVKHIMVHVNPWIAN